MVDMLISFDNNKELILNDNKSQLKSKHCSQLKYWGFFPSKDDNSLWTYAGSSNLISICTKIDSYLRKQRIQFELSDKISKLFSENQRIEQEFSQLKLLAENFKDGNYDSKHFNEFCYFLKTNVRRELREHQIKACYHHYLLKNSANFSVPGSGKTSVVLSVYEKLRTENKVNLIYVAGPTSCFGPWQNEFESTLGRNPKCKILSGGDSLSRKDEYYDFYSDDYELILTSFQTFYRDVSHISNFFNHVSMNVLLVIDEAHYMKQIGGVWADAILEAGQYAKYRLILTGTPCPRKYMDLFNLFDFLWPQNKPISDIDKSKIDISEANGDKDTAAPIIRNSIDPLFYRVRKKDLGLLLPQFHKPIIIEMNKYEKLIYKAISERLQELSYFDEMKSVEFLLKLKKGRIVRLRQLISYAKLLITAIDDYSEDLIGNDKDLQQVIINYDKYERPAKLVALNDLVKKISQNDKKILVWSNFIGTIKLLENYFNSKGEHCRSIYGDIPIYESPYKEEWTREKIVREFLDIDSNLNILIANPAACAESISLHKSCFNAIYYDLSYNCAQYLQSMDRIHRVGGSEENEANYYFLQYADTIDADIMNNLSNKAEKMYAIIENDSAIYSMDMISMDIAEDDGSAVKAYDRMFGV